MCHPHGAKKDFTKGKMLQLPVTNSSKEKFEVNIGLFKTYLAERDYLENVIDNPFKK